LPYYISNSLIIDLLFNHELFENFYFLVQKEVGQKWISSTSKHKEKYSSISVFINFISETEGLFEIPRNAFIPSPSVDGILVGLKLRKKNIEQKELRNFFSFIKNCFRFRRKTLMNNLKGFSGNKKELIKKYLLEKNIVENSRPQNLDHQDYFDLFKY
jgi:16S rRNA (adenine1518-N6/adenine1519-N6)-dimethyltransferase